MTGKEHVERMLKNYQQNKRIMEADELFFERYMPITPEEALEDLTLSTALGDKVQNSNVSDKVARIALTYRFTAKRMNQEALRSVMVEYQQAWQEVAFIDFAIRHLPTQESVIMSAFYIEQLNWTEICVTYHLSNSSLGRFRLRAKERIMTLYSTHFQLFVVDLGKENLQND